MAASWSTPAPVEADVDVDEGPVDDRDGGLAVGEEGPCCPASAAATIAPTATSTMTAATHGQGERLRRRSGALEVRAAASSGSTFTGCTAMAGVGCISRVLSSSNAAIG